jgi:hypothetical protein
MSAPISATFQEGNYKGNFVFDLNITGNCGMVGVAGLIDVFSMSSGGWQEVRNARVEEVVALLEDPEEKLMCFLRTMHIIEPAAMLILSARIGRHGALSQGTSHSYTLMQAFMQQKKYFVVPLPPVANSAHASIDTVIQSIIVFPDPSLLGPAVVRAENTCSIRPSLERLMELAQPQVLKNGTTSANK